MCGKMNEDDIKVYYKDCHDMSELPDKSVQCVVTSPPYWNQRSYSDDKNDLIWGGNKDCNHEWIIKEKTRPNRWAGKPAETCSKHSFVGEIEHRFCTKCNAWRGQLGLEPTPALYIQHILEIMKEVWRVLRDNGTVWFNVADTFATKGGAYGGDKKYMGIHNRDGLSDACGFEQPNPKSIGLKHKDLCLIPARLAIALQEQGWYVRNDIIWFRYTNLVNFSNWNTCFDCCMENYKICNKSIIDSYCNFYNYNGLGFY